MRWFREFGRRVRPLAPQRPFLKAPGATALLLASFVLASGAWTIQAAGAASPSAVAASTSDEARRSALASIPFDKLSATDRAKVDTVLSNVTLFRRLPVQVVECDPQLYLFLVQHPDVIVNIWEVLGVTQVQVRKIGEDTYRVSDSVGLRGALEYLHQGNDTQLAYAEGIYQGPLSVRSAKGRALVILRSGYVRENSGRCYVTSRMDCFLSIDPGATELVTKVLQPVVGNVADNNFVQSVGFLGSLSRTAEVNHRGVQRLSAKLAHVQPELRQELAAHAERIGTQADAALGFVEPASAAEPATTVAGRRAQRR